jgi:hypothetical protein
MIDLKEEMREDMRQEAYEEEKAEQLMYRDYEFAYEQMALDEDSTIKELLDAVVTLNRYGWEVTACELLDTI